MAVYELITILSGRLTPDEVNTWVGNFTATVAQKWGATVTKSQQLGSRTLGYRIRRKDTGYERTGIAIVTELELPSNAPQPLERALALDTSVLRTMLTHAKPAPQKRMITPTQATPLGTATPSFTETGSTPKPTDPEVPASQPMSESELDKRLDEILEVKEL